MIAYSKKHDLSGKNCIAIGESTAKQLKHSGALSIMTSPITTEESMAQTIIDFLGNK